METTDSQIRENLLYSSHDKLLPIFYDADIYFGKEIEQKTKVLKYLKSFEKSWISSRRVEDCMTHKQVNLAESWYSDGVHEWTQTDIYHFENYNMPLNDKFIKYALK